MTLFLIFFYLNNTYIKKTVKNIEELAEKKRSDKQDDSNVYGSLLEF